MNNFALTGASGYIAPRHLQAIYDTGNTLVAASDPHDSVGIMDRYFPDARFFSEHERFDRYLEKLRLSNDSRSIQYMSICSPNYLHDAHARLGLRVGADVICEKPLVVNPWNLDQLQKLEEIYGKKVYNILQLRIHPGLIKIREKLEDDKKNSKYDVVLTYITPRGAWYGASWKGDLSKSGGLMTNIGIHLFDMMMWLFGDLQNSETHLNQDDKVAGFVELKKANVRWFLSTNRNDLPEGYDNAGNKAFRLLTMDDSEIEFSGGFTDLHTRVYENILAGKGHGISDARPALELVYTLRHKSITELSDHKHPFLENKKLEI